MTLTKKHYETLRRYVVRAEYDFDAICLRGNRIPRVVRELEEAGLLLDYGWIPLDDGDGGTVFNADGSERVRRGYRTTDAGLVVLETEESQRAARLAKEDR
jgi:hypothetical protein